MAELILDVQRTKESKFKKINKTITKFSLILFFLFLFISKNYFHNIDIVFNNSQKYLENLEKNINTYDFKNNIEDYVLVSLLFSNIHSDLFNLHPKNHLLNKIYSANQDIKFSEINQKIDLYKQEVSQKISKEEFDSIVKKYLHLSQVDLTSLKKSNMNSANELESLKNNLGIILLDKQGFDFVNTVRTLYFNEQFLTDYSILSESEIVNKYFEKYKNNKDLMQFFKQFYKYN